MKYIIIGLGNYGHVLAEELSALGHEIIGADISESRVDSIKDKVATAFVIDATDEQSLSVLPLNSVDIVIVAIGENFGASICRGDGGPVPGGTGPKHHPGGGRAGGHYPHL